MTSIATLQATQNPVGTVMHRFLELIITSIALLLLLPVLLLVAMAILVTMGRPIFFLQDRTGLHGRVFRIIKFRTMKRSAIRDVDTSTDGERLTGIGRLLRRTSLDELPELLNVLKGNMGLVGPRPLLPEYLELYDDIQARRHDVRPGITGWAQVNGRNALDWESRFQLDVWYVENRSFMLDMKIIIATFMQVLRFSETSQPGHATQDKFRGSTS